MSTALADGLYQGLLGTGVVAAIAAILLGILLLARPGSLGPFLSADPDGAATQVAGRTRRIERGFYRHHRLWGALIVGGALFFLHGLSARYEPERTHALLIAQSDLPWLADWLVDAAVTALTMGNLAALAIGATVFIRPSLLKPLETRANRWISLREGRAAGALLLALGVYALVSFGFLISVN